MFAPSGQVISRKNRNWTEYSQMPQRALNCLADYTHKGKYNGHVVRAELYVLDKAFVPLRISKIGIGRNTNE
ncbi:MAG: hypothetical protein WCF03_05755 [Nitrososphaeraceae archaeon]